MNPAEARQWVHNNIKLKLTALYQSDNAFAVSEGCRSETIETYIQRGILSWEILVARAHSNEEHFTSKDGILLWFNRYDDTNPKKPREELIAYHKFGTRDIARAFIDAVVGDYETKWLDDETLYVNEWFTIRSDPKSKFTVEQIMGKESSAKLPVPYPSYAKTIRAYHFGSNPLNREQKLLSDIEREQDERMAKQAKPQKTNEPKRTEPKPRPSRDGLISLAEVCAELKLDPKEARNALRKANITKPDAGWAWTDKKLIPNIKALVEKARKK